jgi:hypothetical protein
MTTKLACASLLLLVASACAQDGADLGVKLSDQELTRLEACIVPPDGYDCIRARGDVFVVAHPERGTGACPPVTDGRTLARFGDRCLALAVERGGGGGGDGTCAGIVCPDGTQCGGGNHSTLPVCQDVPPIPCAADDECDRPFNACIDGACGRLPDSGEGGGGDRSDDEGDGDGDGSGGGRAEDGTDEGSSEDEGGDGR